MKWIKLVINGGFMYGFVYMSVDVGVELKRLQFYNGCLFLLIMTIGFLIFGKFQEAISFTKWLKGEDK